MRKLTIMALVLVVALASLTVAKEEIQPRELTGPARFATEAVRAYMEGFEGAFPPAGWTHAITNPSYTWYQSMNAFEGNYAAQIPWQDASYQNEILSFEHAITVDEFSLHFATMGSVYWTMNADFTVRVDGDVVWSFYNDFAEGSFIWDVVTVDLGSYVGQTVTIAFVYEGNDGADHHLDAIVVDDQGAPPPPPPFSFCDLVQEASGTGTFSGDTCDGPNNFFESPFHGWTFQGQEHYYGVFMPAGSTFTIDLLHSVDSAIWLLDACADPITILAVVDDEWPGFNETLTYTNDGPDAYFYLVIDSYGFTCGPYTFDFIQDVGDPVAVQLESLSGVKSIFR